MDITKLTGFTPGTHVYAQLRVMTEAGAILATVAPHRLEHGEADANGKLYAAAPDVLAYARKQEELAKQGLELAELVVKHYAGTFALPFADAAMLDTAQDLLARDLRAKAGE